MYSLLTDNDCAWGLRPSGDDIDDAAPWNSATRYASVFVLQGLADERFRAYLLRENKVVATIEGALCGYEDFMDTVNLWWANSGAQGAFLWQTQMLDGSLPGEPPPDDGSGGLIRNDAVVSLTTVGGSLPGEPPPPPDDGSGGLIRNDAVVSLTTVGGSLPGEPPPPPDDGTDGFANDAILIGGGPSAALDDISPHMISVLAIERNAEVTHENFRKTLNMLCAIEHTSVG